MRWLHMVCAAQNLPDALLRTLELGGWQAVPKEDHYELRRLMVDAHERSRTDAPLAGWLAGLGGTGDRFSSNGSLWQPGWLRGLWERSTSSGQLAVIGAREAERDAAQANRSSASMMIARLRPTSGAAGALDPHRLDPQLERAWVFADALQTRADPRGELLALSLAFEHAEHAEHARLVQRERHVAWRRGATKLAGSLRASPALRLCWRGGFLLGARPRGGAEIRGLLASAASSSLTRVRVEFCTRDELSRLVTGVRERDVPLARLDLPRSRLSDLSPLTELPHLRMLRMGDRFEPSLLERLPRLRGLGLDGRVLPRARELAIGKRLELLELHGASALELEGLARHLPHLRELTLNNVSLGESEGPRFLAGAERLERLRLPDTPIRSFAELPALPSLRALILVPANLPLVRELDRLRGLERLALLGGKVGELDSLAALERLEHLALGATRVTELGSLRTLPRLTSLVLEGGDLRRIAGLPQLVGLERLELRRLVNVDLAPLLELPRLRALVLDPGGRRPRGLELLERMHALRELTLPQALLDELSPLARTLARVEVLELQGGERPPRAKLLRELPRLRRLILPGHDPAALASLADSLPEVDIVGDPAPRDLLGLCDPFDWRAAPWPDDLRGARIEHE